MAGVQALCGSGPAGTLAVVLWWCVALLYCFALGASLANMALFRVLRAFLAWFGGFVWVCLVWVLFVACVALYACGVKRIKGLRRICLSFSLFALLFVLLSLCLLSLACSLACLVCSCVFVVFVFSFSLADYTQKKGRKGFAPCVLSSCVVGLLYPHKFV